jgi:hypothetical protein
MLVWSAIGRCTKSFVPLTSSALENPTGPTAPLDRLLETPDSHTFDKKANMSDSLCTHFNQRVAHQGTTVAIRRADDDSTITWVCDAATSSA